MVSSRLFQQPRANGGHPVESEIPAGGNQFGERLEYVRSLYQGVLQDERTPYPVQRDQPGDIDQGPERS